MSEASAFFMMLIHHLFVLALRIKAHIGTVKLFTKQLWIISLVLSLLLGGTLASAHGYDHLSDIDRSSQHSDSWLGELVHPEGDDEHECGLSFLGSAHTVASSVFVFHSERHSADLLVSIYAHHSIGAARLQPPSRAPPLFS